MQQDDLDATYAAELQRRQDALQAEAQQVIADYPYQVGGTDIYDAVLEHGVRTPEQFHSYLLERGMPVE